MFQTFFLSFLQAQLYKLFSMLSYFIQCLVVELNGNTFINRKIIFSRTARDDMFSLIPYGGSVMIQSNFKSCRQGDLEKSHAITSP